ncbi:MAG TPA: hypothetical protein VFH60_09165 [Chloroflexia bacterium]|nr:hypothetical protein [Chloroflexia bacterium]
MQKMLWMNGPAEITIEECIEFVNHFLWNLSVVHGENGQIWVLTGDQAIFYADNTDAVEAFLYGMGLAYRVLPAEMAIDLGKSMGFSEEEIKEMQHP